jgi:dipeptidyl aminopeptidase/acylaminoacyl peptidase
MLRRRFVPFALLSALSAVSAVSAQEPYRTPPDLVRQILDAPRLPALFPSPDGGTLVLASQEGLPSIADLSRPMLRLAGLRIDPRAGTSFTIRGYTGLALRALPAGTQRTAAGLVAQAGAERAVTGLPDAPNLGGVSWSPDGRLVAFTHTAPDGQSLWVADVPSGAARALTGPTLNGTLGRACDWMPGSRQLLCRLVPSGRGAPPEEPRVPVGPIVQQNAGRAMPVATFQDLLTSPHDQRLFDHYATSQLALIDVASGAVTPVGAPGIFAQAEPAPGGRYLLVSRVGKPYSYQVTVRSFPQEVEIWTLTGERVVTVASIPLAENVPVDGVRSGPRNFSWRPGDEATLLYVEALDGGDNRRPAEYRDRLVLLAAPFTTPVELGRLNLRYGGVAWGRNGLALVTEFERRTRKVRTWMLSTDETSGWRILFDRSSEDRYGDPGSPQFTTDSAGSRVLLQTPDGRSIYLAGAGASPEGDRPFLDRLNLRNRRAERLWQAGDSAFEAVAEVLDPRATRIITRWEDRKTPANYVLRSLREKVAPVALTRMTNPAPALAEVRREIVTYERPDGVKLNGTLYYPTDYRDGQRVPVIFWIYPREFASADAAGQVSGNPNRFVLPGGASHLFLLTQGYAVLDNPTLPVVGGDSANNTYVEQTVAGAKAAIDYLMGRGIADGSFGVGGHSYGAFATANLLAHSDLFKAGVARSGAYNRTLTPFGFQNEQRTFWEARDVYLRMMPFASANKVNEPILLIHGMNDNNSGTFPIQSERMYAALKGHGATVDYVQLPYESHGYAARESVMDVVARMIEWFDRYVKGGEGKAATN